MAREERGRGVQYAIQRARVPREVCETQSLTQKLVGFAVRPLSRGKASQQRRERLREEIERKQDIWAGDGLWEGESFAFVAETKAKTIQLRNRTIELLHKALSIERVPEEPQVLQTYTSINSDEPGIGQHFAEARGDCANVAPLAECPPGEAEPPSTKHSLQEQVDIFEPEASINRQVSPFSQASSYLELSLSPEASINRQVSPFSQASSYLELSISSPSRPASVNSVNRPPRIRVSNLGEETVQTPHGVTPKNRAVTPSGVTPKSTLLSPKGRETPSRLRAGPSTRQRKSPRTSNRQSAVAFESSKTTSGLGGSLKSWMEKQVLFEDKRDITIEAVDNGNEVRDTVPATIRLMENKSTGGIRLEVCLNKKIWTSSQIIERSLPVDEVTSLWTWGNKKIEAVEARYKWMSDIVLLRATEEMELPLKDLPVGEKECSRFKVIFGDFDSAPDEQLLYPGIDALRLGFRDLFQKSQVHVHAETAFNLRTGYKKAGMEEKRKDMEIESARRRHNLYENTSKALHDWFVRLDISGDGQLDEDEFGNFLRAVVCSFGQSMDDNQVRKHWREMRTTTDSIGFTQFVNYLLHRFPHVKTMTAFEVKRFEERSKKSLVEEGVRKRDSLVALKCFKKTHVASRLEKLPEQGPDSQLPGIQVFNTEQISIKNKFAESEAPLKMEPVE